MVNKRLEKLKKRLEKTEQKEFKKLEQKEDDNIKFVDKTKFQKKFVKKTKFAVIENLHPNKAIMVNMSLNNGYHTDFVVKLKYDNSFKFDKKTYFVDSDSLYYLLSSRIWCCDFHENFSMAVKRIIPINDIKAEIQQKIPEIENAINPITLKNFINSKILEAIMDNSLAKIVKMLLMICAIGVLVNIVHFIMYIQGSGVLDGIV